MGFTKRFLSREVIINHFNFNKSLKELFEVDSLIFTDNFSFNVFELYNEGMDGIELQEKILELETNQ
jgi:hypothetical protein